jgi:hypothetical protein
VACFGLGGAGSIQTHVGGATFGAVGFGLSGVPTRSVAAWSSTGVGSMVWPRRCRGSPAWLWRNVCLGRGGLFFFFSEITCQYVIGGLKTLVLCHYPTEGVLLVLSTFSEIFYLLSSTSTHLSPVSTPFLHRVYCDFWLSYWVEICRSRFTLLHQLLHDTHLSIGFADIFLFHQWSPCLLLTSPHRSMACTR